MTKKSQDTSEEDAVADDFATTMPAWMTDGLGDDVDAASDADEDVVAAHENAAKPDAATVAEDAEPQVEAAQNADGAIIVLPKRARLSQAEDIIEQLTAAIDADDLVIDAREVEDITSPIVTAIISALNSRADKTPPAAVLAPTPAFIDAFSDLGLFKDLMKMEFRQ
ncbi:MAG: anti-anti-sigma regulatory factor [Paracoccaceae bacterium]|jgi:anti-anti-sigma regulatory factor